MNWRAEPSDQPTSHEVELSAELPVSRESESASFTRWQIRVDPCGTIVVMRQASAQGSR